MGKKKANIVTYILDPNNPPTMTPEQWARLDAMTEEEIEANALSDPDNPPSTDEELDRMASAFLVRKAREAAGMSQPQFADAYHVTIGRLRDLEQGRTSADSAMRAYLRVIARDPAFVRQVLEEAPS
jgi:putative transcriptional regulator